LRGFRFTTQDILALGGNEFTIHSETGVGVTAPQGLVRDSHQR
jgi:hypothetical protein